MPELSTSGEECAQQDAPYKGLSEWNDNSVTKSPVFFTLENVFLCILIYSLPFYCNVPLAIIAMDIIKISYKLLLFIG